MIDEATAPKWQRNILDVVAEVLPKLPIPNIPLESLSNDPAVVDLYVNDPLVNHGMLTARLVQQLFSTITKTQEECKTKVSEEIDFVQLDKIMPCTGHLAIFAIAWHQRYAVSS